MILEPMGRTFAEWVCAQCAEFQTYLPPPSDDWRAWVLAAMPAQPFSMTPLPNPNAFPTWQDWVYALAQQYVE